MNISLPQELRSFIDDQVSEGGYSSTSEYLREIVRKERERARIRELLLDGGASPQSDTVWNVEHFEKMRQRIKANKK